MATIYRELDLKATPGDVWAALEDVGNVHQRLARGFVTDTRLGDGERTVTFANGFVAREKLVALDASHRRLAYSVVDGGPSHHNASFQVLPAASGCRLVWITDVLPDAARAEIESMVDMGCEAIRATLESPSA